MGERDVYMGELVREGDRANVGVGARHLRSVGGTGSDRPVPGAGGDDRVSGSEGSGPPPKKRKRSVTPTVKRLVGAHFALMIMILFVCLAVLVLIAMHGSAV
jgi:hypothetical protein